VKLRAKEEMGRGGRYDMTGDAALGRLIRMNRKIQRR
jgi:hypothetical protein